MASRTSIPQFFSRITSHLTEIELVVEASDFKDICRIDWGQLGQVLVQHQFASLRIVRIVIDTSSFDPMSKQPWADEVRAGLSGLEDRCVLDVVRDSMLYIHLF